MCNKKLKVRLKDTFDYANKLKAQYLPPTNENKMTFINERITPITPPLARPYLMNHFARILKHSKIPHSVSGNMVRIKTPTISLRFKPFGYVEVSGIKISCDLYVKDCVELFAKMHKHAIVNDQFLKSISFPKSLTK